MSAEGALMFARYAYPPNALGYCGPAGAEAMLRGDATADIARRARRFEGAWSYLEFLASTAGIPDPLDERVVEAYWVGGDLLAGVSSASLVSFLTTRFAGQSGGSWRSAGERALPHHTFQVFEVYPWAGLLRRTGHQQALSVLDQCRIRTGVVVAVTGETATVESRPLVAGPDGSLSRGAPRRETVRWSVEGWSLLSNLTPGDRVALHWNWVCDTLTPDQAARIETLEARYHAAAA
ncbi:DUF6390 family protein [Asanoa sp. WMMD1127]|uniref:DUF6390 family protein n=1 Tax=Asanoa sp. WMMD1127 TaxID=3016107 RepID=UPI00241630B5|nr:DUF6390 family protein [Asanoa sp. WMMD1127]MDG4826326.1 DUF6390 family protein [Asanoa sp. WMMD1127]